MPAAYDWAKREGEGTLDLSGIGCRGEKGEIQYELGKKDGMQELQERKPTSHVPQLGLGWQGKAFEVAKAFEN